LKKILVFLYIFVLTSNFVLAVDCITYEGSDLPDIGICGAMCQQSCPSDYCDGGAVAEWNPANGYCLCETCTPKEAIVPEFSTIGMAIAVVAVAIGIGVILYKKYRKEE